MIFRERNKKGTYVGWDNLQVEALIGDRNHNRNVDCSIYLSRFEFRFSDMDDKWLTELSSDEEAEIISIHGGWIMQVRLKELGIVEGRNLKKISHVGLGGPVIILVNRAQVAIGAGMASRVVVKSHGQRES